MTNDFQAPIESHEKSSYGVPQFPHTFSLAYERQHGVLHHSQKQGQGPVPKWKVRSSRTSEQVKMRILSFCIDQFE